MLVLGNARYSSGRATAPRRDPIHRESVAKAQAPIAAVLCCSDSRASPEVVFDQGVGDLFVVRVAGNTINDTNIGSLEFAVHALGVRLIVVLGHQRCGAVVAAIDQSDSNSTAAGHLGAVIDPILPAVEHSRHCHGDRVDNAVMANARLVAKRLSTTGPILSNAIETHGLLVVPMHYSLDTGVARVLDVDAV